MAARSTETVRQELASERERLGDAVSALRAQATAVRRKLPVIAAAAAGAGVVVKVAGKLLFHRGGKQPDPPPKKRSRLPFLGRG